MKKIVYILIVVFVFILGITLGDTSYTKNKIIDGALEKFEEDIQKENNEYENIILKPRHNIFNNIAEKIENLIDLVSEKIKEKM